MEWDSTKRKRIFLNSHSIRIEDSIESNKLYINVDTIKTNAHRHLDRTEATNIRDAITEWLNAPIMTCPSVYVSWGVPCLLPNRHEGPHQFTWNDAL